MGLPPSTSLLACSSLTLFGGPQMLTSCCPPPSHSPVAGFPNHALLLVGYSTLPAGSEYILAKSSLGAAWGEAGFARIAMTADGSGTCGLYLAALQPGTVTLAAPASPAPAPAKNGTKTAAPAPAPAPAKNTTKAVPAPIPAKTQTKSDGKAAAPAPPASKKTTTTKH